MTIRHIISTNQKTIGINKLGTLLSSQTTGHYSKAVPPAFAGSLRSNFSNLPDQPDLGKSTFPRFPIQAPAPPGNQHAQKRTIFQAVIKGGRPPQFPAPGCLTRGDSEDITRPPAPTQIHPNTTQKPAKTAQTQAKQRHRPAKTTPKPQKPTPVKPVTPAKTPRPGRPTPKPTTAVEHSQPHTKNQQDMREQCSKTTTT